MALTNYTTLQASLKSALHRADLDSAVPDFIALAEDKLNRRLRLRGMESRVQASIASEYIALPDGFLAMRNFQLNTSPRTRLEYATPEYLDAKYGDSTATGVPVFYTLVGGEIQLAPVPGGTYTAELDFYEKLDIATDSTNWVLTNAPRVYFYGAMAEANRYTKDDKRAAEYDALQEMAIADLERADERDQYPDSGLQMRADIGAPV
jgi:hypothetical protein